MDIMSAKKRNVVLGIEGGADIMREGNSIETMNLERAIEVLKVHKVNETDHYRDCGECSRALEVAINHLEKENSKSDDIQDIIDTAHYWQDKYLNLLDLIKTKLKEEREKINKSVSPFYKDKLVNRAVGILEEILRATVVDKKGE